MSYRAFDRTSTKLLIAGFIGLAGLLFIHGTAHAAAPVPSNTLPESSDFGQGNNVWLTVAKADGVNYLLDATTSIVRIYSGSKTVTLTINNGGHCPGNGPDAGATEAEAQTLFQFRKLKYSASYDFKSAPYVDDGPAASSVTSAMAGCGLYTLTLNNDQANNVPVGEQGYAQNGTYAFEVSATWQNLGASGWNQFKLGVDVGRLSYYAGSGDKFALKAANAACGNYVYPGCTGYFRMGFAPNCKLDDTDTRQVTVQWFDADAGQPNQGGDPEVKTQFIEYGPNNQQTSYDVPVTNIINTTTGGSGGSSPPGSGNLYITTGNGQHGTATITIRGHHKYAWYWYDIHTANGIQFQLPTDSYNTLIDFNQDCGTPQPLDASCTAQVAPNPPQTNLKLSSSATVTWKFTNTGPTPWTTNDNPLTQYTRFINGSRVNSTTVPNNVAPGGSFSITVSETAPATGSKVIKYTMWQSGKGAFGSPCTTTITTCTGSCGGTPGSGSINVSCASIDISGVNSPATTTASGVSKVITRVPTAIVVTDPNGGTYTYLVNTGGKYGVGNLNTGGNGSFSVPTFQIPGINFTMYPHQSYTIQLAIEGVNPVNSATYPDNGFWNPTNNANDGNFYYGPQIIDTEVTPTDCLTAVCSGTSSAEAEPGQVAKGLTAGIQFNNKSTASFPTNDPNAYEMRLNTSGGLKVSNVSYGTIAANTTATTNITFDAEVDYTGSFSVSLFFQGDPLDIGQQNPCPTQTLQPKTRGFIQVSGGDVAAGGGFAQGAACGITNPYYVSPVTSTASGNQKRYSGGIATFEDPITGLGSRAQFGVLSLGFDMGNTSAKIGFPSLANAVAASPSVVGQSGGLLNESGTSPWHCAIDYFDTTQKKGTDAPKPFGGGAVPSATDQFIATGGPGLTISASTIAAGQQTTIYVDGDVTINGNITYVPGYDATDSTKVPYFVLIARGNITVSDSVTRLDGLYIAQPDLNSGKGGIFATCPQGQLPNGRLCAQQLVINGAVIAQELQLLREHGTVGPLTSDPNDICTPTGSSNCPPAELFNYIPAMVVGQPNLAPIPGSFESLFSLPPVF